MWAIEEILQGSGGKIQYRGAQKLTEHSLSGFSINSRTIRRDEVFIALSGPNFDGHDFVSDALEKGGTGAMVSLSAYRRRESQWRPLLKKHFFVLVPDPIQALQAMAHWHRNRFSVPLIAVTGSNGKTTTKEMIACILLRRGPILKNEGNLNNHIGLPLSLVALKGEDHAAVLEMGISRKGEMEKLCTIAEPTIGLITNIGPAHLACLGNLEGVAQEKGMLFKAIKGSQGTAIINRDDPYLRAWENKQSSCWTFSLDSAADVSATNLEEEAGCMRFNLHLNREGHSEQEVRLPAVGRHQVVNALAAASVSAALGMGLNDIRDGLQAFQPPASRGELMQIKGVHILFDAYNANPASVRAGLGMISSYRSAASRGGKQGRKIAILGDMLELGDWAESAHFEVGQRAAESNLDALITVGDWAEKMAEGARLGGLSDHVISVHRDLASVQMFIREELVSGDCVLIKGSRGMKMEGLLATIESKGSD